MDDIFVSKNDICSLLKQPEFGFFSQMQSRENWINGEAFTFLNEKGQEVMITEFIYAVDEEAAMFRFDNEYKKRWPDGIFIGKLKELVKAGRERYRYTVIPFYSKWT